MQLQILSGSNQEYESNVNHSQIIDPREQLLEELEQQNDQLLQEVVKAKHVFEENLIEKNKTIAAQAKTIEELKASLIQSENRNKELSAIQAAQLKINNEFQEFYKEKLAKASKEVEQLCNHVIYCQKNQIFVWEYQLFQSSLDLGNCLYIEPWHPNASSGTSFIGGGFEKYSGQYLSTIVSLIGSQMDQKYKDSGFRTLPNIAKEIELDMELAIKVLNQLKDLKGI